jgi:hypothetical protein
LRKAGWSVTDGGTLTAVTPPGVARFSLIVVTRRCCGKNRIFPLAIWPKQWTLSCVNQKTIKIQQSF